MSKYKQLIIGIVIGIILSFIVYIVLNPKREAKIINTTITAERNQQEITVKTNYITSNAKNQYEYVLQIDTPYYGLINTSTTFFVPPVSPFIALRLGGGLYFGDINPNSYYSAGGIISFGMSVRKHNLDLIFLLGYNNNYVLNRFEYKIGLVYSYTYFSR